MMIRSLFVLGMTSLAATSVYSQDATVTTDATSAKLGAEFRGELIWADYGFKKLPGNTPDATTTIDVTKVRVILSGKVNPDVDYKFKFNLLDPTTTPLYYGYGTYNMGGAMKMGLSIGKMKVQQGGWDQKLNEFSDHVQGNYKKQFAFASYEPMIAFSLNVAGKATLQVLNDVTTADSGQWNTTQHPTFVLGWFGDFGAFAPVLAYGSYDNNKSNWIDVGGKFESGPIQTRLDVKLDTISNKVVENNKAKSKEDKATSVSLKAAYEIKGTATPWVYYSSYNKAQYEDKTANKKDAKVNASSVNAEGKFIYALDDNATVIGLGADLGMFGKNWTPFVALTSTSAKFADTKDATKEETKTSNTLQIGCYGSI